MTTTPKLCVTVTAPTMAELCTARDRVADADLVELRLDTVRDPDVPRALAGRTRPVIVTCRAAWEGGQFAGSEEARRALLRQALDHGADYVDVEFRAGFADLIAVDPRRIVVSSHDFETMPADLPERVRAMRATGAAVVKIAGKASSLRDCVTLLDVATRERGRGDLILIGMGDHGLATRVLAGRFGSAWTYAGSVASVGQVTAEILIDRFRFRRITPQTAIFGLTGAPISHSVSPAMHNAACAATGVDAVYLPFPATDADDFLALAEALGIAGASITIPYKVPLFERADAVDDTARAIGAINTVKREGDRWIGRNTDLPGFLNPLDQRGCSLAGARVSVLGAGGAARSVAYGAAGRGARVTVHARDAERARPVAALAHAEVGPWPPVPGSWDLLVNTTPVGMHPRTDASPITIPSGSRGVVYDLIYNPGETALLRQAAAAGCTTIGGLDMLVEQAIEQFAWWTGVRPPAAPMRAAALARLAEFTDR